jgi:hypothetical protein
MKNGGDASLIMSSQVTYTISTDETTQRREGTAWRQA